ncbi:MAG: hypothetical protein LBI82_07570, partial [Dysgonamonadaceae bacterium]|nr:hypothetical protein [Dysgonamonadaceae bacterium]
MKTIIKIMTVAFVAMMLPATVLQAGNGPNDPRIATDKSTYYVGDKVTVTVSNTLGGNIFVHYCLLEGRYSATDPSKKWQMNKDSDTKHWFGPMSDAWNGKWLKIIAENRSKGTWSDEIYMQIQAKPQSGPTPPTHQQTQTKPRITLPSNRSSSTHGSQLNVTVSGNNIEVTYVGLNGEPNPSNTNESQNGFYTGKMYSSGNNKFYFTPNTSAWQNKWVKII